jgi:hypothetical protein
MIASTATADSRLRQACLRPRGTQADRLAARDLDILVGTGYVVLDGACPGSRGTVTTRGRGEGCQSPLSRLPVPVSQGDSAISSRTVMNNAG